MAYGLRYFWKGWYGLEDSSECVAIFESKEAMTAWIDRLAEYSEDRAMLVVLGEGRISSDLQDTLDFISEQIPKAREHD
jgi:hypothetical protein